MTPERMSALAKNAAQAMLDRSISIREREKVINPPEVNELPLDEYTKFRDMILTFMRELSREEK